MRLWIAVLLVLLAACAAPAPAAAPQAAPALALDACRLTGAGAAQSVAAQCGSLDVPEDYAHPGGPTIALRVAVVPAVGRSPAADPLFLLAGGPGQAATEVFAPLLPALSQVGQSRDIVLVDQRGTGGSAALSCPPEEEGQDAAAWSEMCLAGLASSPALYGTAAAARDLDAVRAALGYPRLNLLGVSYGTRMAQAYARLFPDRTRSLILDGVVPPGMAIGAEMAADGQRALGLIFARCADEPACAAAFPDPQGDLESLLARLEATPADVALADPFTGEQASVKLTRELAATTVQALSYAPETAALLPLLIHRAAAGDPGPLAAQSIIVGQDLAASVSTGLRMAVLCAEDVPRFPDDAAGAGYLGGQIVANLRALCAGWPSAPAEARPAPAPIAAPTLLLSGEADPVTPPAQAAAAAVLLPNSLQISAPGQGHNVFFRGCLPGLIADFLAAGSPAGLDTGCVGRLAAPPFFTSFTGP